MRRIQSHLTRIAQFLEQFSFRAFGFLFSTLQRSAQFVFDGNEKSNHDCNFFLCYCLFHGCSTSIRVASIVLSSRERELNKCQSADNCQCNEVSKIQIQCYRWILFFHRTSIPPTPLASTRTTTTSSSTTTSNLLRCSTNTSTTCTTG